MKAIQNEAFGNPAEVMKLVDVPDVGTPGEGEVVIALEASPINMSDLLMISGRYGYRPKLPSIVGTEGVGRVVAVGGGVTHLKEGDRTLVPYPSAAWAERIKADGSRLRPLAGGDIHQLAMLGINPATAYLLLTEYVALPSGAWVGGDVVLVDGPDLAKRVAAETGGAPIALAVDGVADTATMNLLGCLAAKGVLVFYSAISGKPFVGPALPLIFHDVSIRGFWLANWFNTATSDKITAMYDRLTPLVASGAISSPVAGTFSFGQIAEAVAVASKNRGKALFTPG